MGSECRAGDSARTYERNRMRDAGATLFFRSAARLGWMVGKTCITT
jgi:hypothetical protein